MSEDISFLPPKSYFKNCNLAVNDDILTLLKNKEVVSNCEEMITDYQSAFKKVSC